MVYILTNIISILLLKISVRTNGSINKRILLYILLIPVTVAGLRSENVGADTQAYVLGVFELCKNCNNFIDAYLTNALSYDVEEGYLLFNFLIGRISDDFNFYLFSAHLLMLSLLFFCFYRLRDKIQIWHAGFIFLFVFYYETLNIARQCFAIMFLLVALTYVFDKKYKKAFLFQVLGYTFHHTAIIFIFILLLYVFVMKYQFFSRTITKYILIVSIGSSLTILSAIFQIFVSLGILSMRYEELYLDDDRFGSNVPVSLFALTFMNWFVFVLATWKKRKDRFLVYCEYIFIISFLLCFSGLISTFAVRIGTYFLYTSILLYPMLFNKYIKNLAHQYILFSFYILYWALVVIVANISKTWPYESTVLGI